MFLFLGLKYMFLSSHIQYFLGAHLSWESKSSGFLLEILHVFQGSFISVYLRILCFLKASSYLTVNILVQQLDMESCMFLEGFSSDYSKSF